MKPMQEHAGSRQDKSAFRILLIFLIVSLLATWLIVYFVNFLLRAGY
ncbi:hypothetical protein HRH25_12715 [Flavisolibacter sp. BT320]|nr:hypothetical protein [Flavisolibacter longurius]